MAHSGSSHRCKLVHTLRRNRPLLSGLTTDGAPLGQTAALGGAVIASVAVAVVAGRTVEV